MGQLYKDRVKKVGRILSYLRIAHRCGEFVCFHKNRARGGKKRFVIQLCLFVLCCHRWNAEKENIRKYLFDFRIIDIKQNYKKKSSNIVKSSLFQ